MKSVSNVKKFTLALCQMKTGSNKQNNLKRAQDMIDTAVKLYKPQVVVLPEFFNSPYGIKSFEDYVEDENDSESVNFLSKIAKEHEIYLIGGSMPIKRGDNSYNTCYCFDKSGETKLIYSKLHLFDIDIPGKITYLESKKLTKGENFGVFETEYGNIGIGICYDIRFPEYLLLLKQEYDIDLVVYPAAFNTITGPLHWDILAKCRALDNNVFLALCSPSRNYENPDDYQAYGHSMVVDPFGQIVTTTGHEEDILIAKIDFEKNYEIKTQIPVWKQKRHDLYKIEKLI